MDNEYHRQYRIKNRERILADQRKRRAGMTLQQKAIESEKNKARYHAKKAKNRPCTT